jgi:hypothetical protein
VRGSRARVAVARVLPGEVTDVKSLQHEAAYELALEVCRMVNLRDDERYELFQQVYVAAKAQLTRYEEQAARRIQRLGPSQN